MGWVIHGHKIAWRSCGGQWKDVSDGENKRTQTAPGKWIAGIEEE